jgi:ribosomal protein S27E
MKVTCPKCGNEVDATPPWLSRGGRAKVKKGFSGRPELLAKANEKRKRKGNE